MENKFSHNTIIKCEKSFDSLVANKISSKDVTEKKAVSFISGILHVTS